MKCKEVEQLIQPYIEDRIGSEELVQFMDHLSHCAECQDELEIRYLIKEGLSRLENGETLDLKKELAAKLSHSVRLIHFRSKIKIMIFLIESAAGLSLLISMILLFI